MNEVQFATLPTRKIFFRCALPGLLAMVVSSIYMMIDGIFVGRYIGSHALAAVNLAFPVIMILFAVGDMVAVGSSVKIALLLGQGKNKEANGLFRGFLHDTGHWCPVLPCGISCGTKTYHPFDQRYNLGGSGMGLHEDLPLFHACHHAPVRR